jgi:hypothetical protein
MLTQIPCRPIRYDLRTDRARITVPCMSNFGIGEVTLFLRADGSLSSSAGDFAWRYHGDWVVCEIPHRYPSLAPYLFAVRKADCRLLFADTVA